MAKVRLSVGNRQWLFSLARKSITCAAELRARDVAYKVALPLMQRDLRAKYPPRDMYVPKKYSCAETCENIRVSMGNGRVEEFVFDNPKTQGPRVPTNLSWGKVHEIAPDTIAAVELYVKARVAYQRACEAKLADYKALIYNARNLEEIESVWPKASELRSVINRSLPTVVSAEVIARIRADQAPAKSGA